jgi:hypothetical protein
MESALKSGGAVMHHYRIVKNRHGLVCAAKVHPKIYDIGIWTVLALAAIALWMFAHPVTIEAMK